MLSRVSSVVGLVAVFLSASGVNCFGQDTESQVKLYTKSSEDGRVVLDRLLNAGENKVAIRYVVINKKNDNKECIAWSFKVSGGITSESSVIEKESSIKNSLEDGWYKSAEWMKDGIILTTGESISLPNFWGCPGEIVIVDVYTDTGVLSLNLAQ